jgi:hypothetical protein
MPLQIFFSMDMCFYILFMRVEVVRLQNLYFDSKEFTYYKRIEIEKISLSPTAAWDKTHNRPSHFSPSPFLCKAHNRPSLPQQVAQRPNTVDPRVTPETEFVKNSLSNMIHPLFDFFLTISRSSLVRDKIVRTPPLLRFGARSPINSGRCPSNFCRKDQTLIAKDFSLSALIHRHSSRLEHWRRTRTSRKTSSTIFEGRRTTAGNPLHHRGSTELRRCC